MGFYQVVAILGFSIVFAAVLGLIRFRNVEPAYQPLIYIVCLGLLNHSLSLVMVYYFRSNTINGNIFVLIESLLYVWLFSNWGLFKRRPNMALLLYSLLPAAWIADNLVWHNLHTANAGFRIFNSFIMIFLAIEQTTTLVTKAKTNLLKSAIFITCCCMLIYFSYKAFIEVFFLVEADSSLRLITNIYSIFVGINFFVNLLFAWAIICVPKKKRSLRSP